MIYTRKNRKIIRANNSIDPASSSVCWGKKAKHYRGVAGKGGATTNNEIPDSVFNRELKEMEGNENA